MLPASDSTSSEVKQLSNTLVGTQEDHKMLRIASPSQIFEPGTTQNTQQSDKAFAEFCLCLSRKVWKHNTRGGW